jgi:RimJ/RimL family protein N-acetyltransferase
MEEAVFLEGESVRLRPLHESDLAFVTAGVNHPAVRSRVGQSVPTTLARERRYVEELDERTDAVQVLVVADRERVGVVELDPIDREAGVAELAFWVHPDHRRRGYAREAVELVVGYAFDELRLHKVTASAFAPNEASRGLLESLGFVEEGVGREDAFLDGAYRDTHYYGLLEREWRAREDESGSGAAGGEDDGDGDGDDG